MEAKFAELLDKYMEQHKTCLIITSEKSQQIIDSIQKAKNEPTKLARTEKTWNRRYTLRMEEEQMALYHDSKKVVKKDQLFNILYENHIKLGHGGRDLMWKELSQTYFGISKDIIMLFLANCENCTLKQAKAKKSIVVKPILSKEFNSRCQVDLIDLQSRPDNDYKFIMVYQDHLTKYVVLNPLERKTGSEVAKMLIKFFSDFGAPRILQSDNGKEFANQIVREVCRLWPEIKIVHGKPRHSQSQGSVERANRDVMDILTIELRERKTIKWASLLPFVQAKKNRRFHKGIGRSPYEALFGRSMNLANEDSQMPSMETRGISEDEELEEFRIIDGAEFVTEVEDRYVQSEHVHDDTADESEVFEENDVSIAENREGARTRQKAQAEKMLEGSSKRFAPIEPGTNVRLRVEDVDRSKIDHRNTLGVVLSVEDGFYKIGTKGGVLKQLYSRNQFEPCGSNFITQENVPPTEVSLRESVGIESLGGSQGHRHCNCTTKCGTKSCTCVKAGVRCNSRCHHSNTCHNKFDVESEEINVVD